MNEENNSNPEKSHSPVGLLERIVSWFSPLYNWWFWLQGMTKTILIMGVVSFITLTAVVWTWFQTHAISITNL